MAIKIEAADAKLLNVEANGTIQGLSYGSKIPSSEFCLPSFLHLGKLKAGHINTYLLELDSISEAKLETNICGVSVSPNVLHTGHNEIRIEAGYVSAENFIYGSLNIVMDGVIHKLRLFGEARSIFTSAVRRIHFNGTDWDEKPILQSDEQKEIPSSKKTLMVELRHSEDTGKKFEIDPCVFLLEGGKARRDEDMFYFNHPGTSETPVYIHDYKVYLHLEEIDSKIQKIVLYYAIISKDYDENFQRLQNPRIIISQGINNSECFYMPIILTTSPDTHKTLHALEFCKVAGQWKVCFYGKCCTNSIKDICISLGLKVK